MTCLIQPIFSAYYANGKMKIDNCASRQRPLLLATIGLLIITGFLAGCASSPGDHPESISKIMQDAEKTSTSDKHTNYVAPARRTNYVPQKWPAPDQDLWSEIRAGFELPANDDRLRVRVWTQYYATHDKHLSSSLQRAQPYLWYVVQQLKIRHIPTEIALLPIVESGYNPVAVSSSGASGMWQFMPATGKYMNLKQNWWFDGRNDPTGSTDAALNYLQSLALRYDGNWLKAMAAYNAGPGRVDEAIQEAVAAGLPTDYWDLNLPEETRQYVPQVLALRRILKEPAKFGVVWPQLENRQHTQLVTLPGQASLKTVAKLLDIPESELRALNPGLRRDITPPGHRQLRVPADRAEACKARLAKVDPSSLRPRTSGRVHVVRRGETLGRIARRYGVRLSSLRAANGISGNRLLVGQRLTIPGAGTPRSTPTRSVHHTYVVRSGDTLWRVAQKFNTSVAHIRRMNNLSGTTLRRGQRLSVPGQARTASTASGSKVVVHPGDTLWSIAHANGITVAQLRSWNQMAPNAPLISGSTLTVDGPA